MGVQLLFVNNSLYLILRYLSHRVDCIALGLLLVTDEKLYHGNHFTIMEHFRWDKHNTGGRSIPCRMSSSSLLSLIDVD